MSKIGLLWLLALPLIGNITSVRALLLTILRQMDIASSCQPQLALKPLEASGGDHQTV